MITDEDRRICYYDESVVEDGYYVNKTNNSSHSCSTLCKTCSLGPDLCTSCNWDKPYLTIAAEMTQVSGVCTRECNGYRDETDLSVFKCYANNSCPDNMFRLDSEKMCYGNSFFNNR